MSWAIPQSTVSAVREGDRGIVVWALQRGLREFSPAIMTDGIFGSFTTMAVGTFQRMSGLQADGIAGPITQRALNQHAVGESDDGLPDLLLNGFAEMEGGWLLGAVNRSVPGGVDCGVFQRRVYVADYGNDAVIERAFDARYQAGLLAGNLLSLRSIFAPRAGTRDESMPVAEKAWRLAALNHNYPSAADTLSRTPLKSLSAYWTTPASWVRAIGARFPDGHPVETPLEWAHLYAGVLNGAYGSHGAVTKYVNHWA